MPTPAGEMMWGDLNHIITAILEHHGLVTLRLRHRLCRRRPAGRKWVGIDVSPKAVELVNMRLQQAMGSLFHHGYVTARTDIEKPRPYRENKHVLFGQQEGLCAGCKGDFPFKLFEVDHRVPRSRGGTDHLDNLQLFCSSCNRIKGDRPQEYLVARLAEIGG